MQSRSGPYSTELAAIRTILGDHAPKASVTANKSMTGHTLGAAGALEAIATWTRVVKDAGLTFE